MLETETRPGVSLQDFLKIHTLCESYGCLHRVQHVQGTINVTIKKVIIQILDYNKDFLTTITPKKRFFFHINHGFKKHPDVIEINGY